MNKGFTLIELLAVVAILAILAIIALPNVLTLYRNTRKNTFLREVQSVYDAAKTKYFLSQYGSSIDTATYTYTNVGTGTSTIDIQNGSGGDNFKYCVILDANGYATTLKVTNGSFSYTNKANSVINIQKTSDIKDAQVTETTTGLTECKATQ